MVVTFLIERSQRSVKRTKGRSQVSKQRAHESLEEARLYLAQTKVSKKAVRGETDTE